MDLVFNLYFNLFFILLYYRYLFKYGKRCNKIPSFTSSTRFQSVVILSALRLFLQVFSSLYNVHLFVRTASSSITVDRTRQAFKNDIHNVRFVLFSNIKRRGKLLCIICIIIFTIYIYIL